MEYNGKKGMKTTTFLNLVHAKLFSKYKIKDNNDIQDAKDLQEFFQKLKKAATDINSMPTELDKILYSQLVQRTTELFSSKSNASVSNLFRRLGRNSYERGDLFERELEAVIKAVAEKASGELPASENTIRTGQITGTTTITDDLMQEVEKKIAEGLSEEKAFNSVLGSNDFYQKRVAIKTDIQGIEVEINVGRRKKIDKEIIRIQKLLAQATFSAKSYSSASFNTQTQKIEILKDAYPTIHLGNSNPFRAVYGALTSLGYNHSTAVSAYAASSNLVKNKNQDVINHIYHLRYLYELTGAGTKILNGQYKESRFLIYNDPATDDIFVKSTAEILNEVFETPPDWNGDPFGGIYISKSKFQ